MAGSVKVSRAVLDAMRREAHACLPNECCGLLAGSGDVITHCFPAANAMASGREYSIDPGELIRTLRAMREHGLIHRGIYHSHPSSENFPSPRDVEMAFYPACTYFIISPHALSKYEVRAYSIEDGHVTELSVEVAAI